MKVGWRTSMSQRCFHFWFLSQNYMASYLPLAVLQEVPELYLGLDVHPHGFLHSPPLHLGPSLSLHLPQTPLSFGGAGAPVVDLSVSPYAFGGCGGSVLWTDFLCPGKWRTHVPSTATASPAWRPDQGLLPQSRYVVEGLRTVSGSPHPLPLLPDACGGSVCLQPSPGSSSVSEKVPHWTVALHLPPVHRSAGSLDVPAAVFARTLPKVPLPAAGGCRGLSGLEGTLSGLVSTHTKLELSRSARRGTSYHSRQAAPVGQKQWRLHDLSFKHGFYWRSYQSNKPESVFIFSLTMFEKRKKK